MGILAASNVKKLKSTGDPSPLAAKAANKFTMELVSLADPLVQDSPCNEPHVGFQPLSTIPISKFSASKTGS